MKRIFVLFGFMVLAIATIPQGANAGACRPGEDGCITANDIAFDSISSSRIVNGAVTDAKIAAGISAEKIKQYENVYTVAKGAEQYGFGVYSTIQGAIVDAISNGVKLVKVMPGTYTEDITIDDEIYLQGSGSKSTIIQPATTNGTAIIMDWGYGQISGFYFKPNGNSTAISLINAEPVTIEDNYFSVNKGVVVTDSEVWVEDNTFDYVESAVYVGSAASSAELTITGNNFIGDRNCSTSIHINNANANVTATNNRFDGIQCAPIYIRDSNSVVLINNYIYGVTNPGGSGSTGIQVEGTNIVIQGNYITNNLNGGIYLTNSQSSSSVLIKDNSITSNGWNGIYLSSLPLGVITISNNQLTGNLPHDINDLSTATSNISFNIFDSCSSTTANANYNVSADGSSTVTCQ